MGGKEKSINMNILTKGATIQHKGDMHTALPGFTVVFCDITSLLLRHVQQNREQTCSYLLKLPTSCLLREE